MCRGSIDRMTRAERYGMNQYAMAPDTEAPAGRLSPAQLDSGRGGSYKASSSSVGGWKMLRYRSM